ARNLRQRVSSYFRSSGLSIKTQALVVRIADIQTTVTHSETEALLLEQNLIKSLRPPFNILLRDDKSYPYIYLSSHAQYPSLTLRRGRNKRAKGTWFGPYPSAGAVRESLNLLQKLFKVRQCDDVFFSNRSRPCLQYQIERCSAPCVGLISPEEYARDLMHAAQFLEGRNPSILQDLMQAMEAAAVRLDFERAAVYRDQISRLRVIQEQQAIEAEAGDADVLVVRQDAGVVCVILIVVRGGRVLGTKHFFPRFVLEMTAAEQLGGFIGQYYLGGMPLNGWPREILVPEPPEDVDVLAGALSALAGRELPIRHKVRGERRRWLELAATNAEQTLRSHLSSKETIYRRFLSLRDVLDM
ncbi:MAG: excinuclease ABC subunit UvrC, partial [Gammaproteobacteria bacterium]|nr:excinuclease ABC subunit UvrC [Gammaproteobacteria bacterium]